VAFLVTGVVFFLASYGRPVLRTGLVNNNKKRRCSMKTNSKRFWELPHVKLGWWAVGLAAASFVLQFAWSILPGGAWLSFLCGLAGGVVALIAITRQQERSWLVYLSILPMLGVFVFILAEFLIPH
jgi:hypothetical protein